jgi:hypothetical protein
MQGYLSMAVDNVARLHMIVLHGDERMFKRQMAQAQSNKTLELSPKAVH